MTTSTVSHEAAKAMDETAAWAVSKVVTMPRTAGNAAAVKDATALLESAARALQAAQAMHRAARIEKDVGRFATGLQYVSVYFPAIREFVTLGFSCTPEEPGDAEQPTINAYLEISEVWMRGVEIGVLTPDYTDVLETALENAIKQGAEL